VEQANYFGKDDSCLDYIFEARISVLVTGIDNRVWTAYCFVDTYFKEKPHNESVEFFHSQKKDPHSGGKANLEKPVWFPRLYFLRTLAFRLEQVKEEWNNVVFQHLQHMKPYVSQSPRRHIL
jgi:hypothetical protein